MTIFVSRTDYLLFPVCVMHDILSSDVQAREWGGGGRGGMGVSYPFPYQCIIYAALF